MITSTIPDNPAHWHAMRARVLTSTDIATLFGYNRYQTLTELWWLKKAHQTQKRADTEAMKRGREREPIIASLISHDLRRPFEPMKEFICDQDRRAGSSYDARLFFGWGSCPLEIKSVSGWAFTRGYWHLQRNNVTYAGPRVELQLQWEMMVGNFPCIYLGVEAFESKRRFVGRREPHALTYRMMDDKRGEFWKAFDRDIPLHGVTNRKPAQLRLVA